MDNYPIQYTDQSLQDLRDIYDYISIDLKSPGVAAAQVKRIRDEIRSLSTFPKRYKTVDWEPWASRGMHQMTIDHFIVFYVADDEKLSVQIARVIYGKRDIPSLINNPESDSSKTIRIDDSTVRKPYPELSEESKKKHEEADANESAEILEATSAIWITMTCLSSLANTSQSKINNRGNVR